MTGYLEMFDESMMSFIHRNIINMYVCLICLIIYLFISADGGPRFFGSAGGGLMDGCGKKKLFLFVTLSTHE